MIRTLEQIVLDYQKAKNTLVPETKSWDWFIKQSKEIRKEAAKTSVPSTQSILKNEPGKLSKFPTSKSGKNTLIGKMILFQYDAKTKAKLPYWDSFPLGFPIEIYSNGYLMLNLHYLPPGPRAKLMDNLYSFMADHSKGITEKSRLLLSYRLLKEAGRSGLYRPCVKRYLFSNVRSKWTTINPTEWEMAAMLPFQRFNKASTTTVWADSIKEINKG